MRNFYRAREATGIALHDPERERYERPNPSLSDRDCVLNLVQIAVNSPDRGDV
jgi:hypothetical protein